MEEEKNQNTEESSKPVRDWYAKERKARSKKWIGLAILTILVIVFLCYFVNLKKSKVSTSVNNQSGTLTEEEKKAIEERIHDNKISTIAEEDKNSIEQRIEKTKTSPLTEEERLSAEQRINTQ